MEVPQSYRRLERSKRFPGPGAQLIRPADADDTVSITIVVRQRPDAPLLPSQEYWATHISPRQRTYLSREALAARYGASEEDVARVAEFAESKDLTVTGRSCARRSVFASGTVQQMSRAFAVEINHYTSADGNYRGREGHVHVPEELIDVVEGVFGLDNRPLFKRHNNGGPSGASTLTPPTVAGLYQFPSASNVVDQAIGVCEFVVQPPGQPQQSAGLVLDPTTKQPTDVDQYLQSLGLPQSKVAIVSVNNAPTAATGSLANPSNDVECTLDVDVAASVAVGATVVVYVTTNDEKGWHDVVTTAINDTTNNPWVLSISYGSPELLDLSQDGLIYFSQDVIDAVDVAFQMAAAIGLTVFAATGDRGSDGGVGTGVAYASYPATSQWVTAVGGTYIANVSGGNFDEGTWSDDIGATGGGVSTAVGLPSWQEGIGVPPNANPPRTQTGRGIPDIAGNASVYSGYNIVVYGEQASNEFSGPIGGTSASSPLYAALIALINANLGVRTGFLNPTLYALGALQTLGEADVFRDIDDGVTNSYSGDPPAPFYTSGPGWDACTGWGSVNGTALLTFLQQLFQKSLTFIFDRSSFGQDEVDSQLANAPSALFDQALFVVVDGLRPKDFPGGGITELVTALSPTTAQLALLAQWAPSISVATGTNIVFTATEVSSDDPSLSPEVQRFTFTYQVKFPDSSAFDFSSPPSSELLTIQASLAIAPSLSVTGEIELVKAADPFFSDFANGNPSSWLSADLRVFPVEEGASMFGVTLSGSTAADALSFIQEVMAALTKGNGTASGETFDSLPNTEQASALSIWPTTIPIFPGLVAKTVFNFALARVRLNGLSDVANAVRVFFRVFETQTTAALTYQTDSSGNPVGSYRQTESSAPDGHRIALLGLSSDGTEYVSIPCFATERVANTTASNNMSTQADPPNAQIIAPSAGGEVDTFFGCWLDTNQTTPLFPSRPPAEIDGPFSGNLQSILQVIMRGGHYCLAAELVYDEAPIIDGATPSTSDKLAQRNLAFTIISNPGTESSRVATHTFEIRPSPTTLNVFQRPDELMIDWGNVPDGSVASIYLPAVDAYKVIQLAAELYTTHFLTASDPHTLQCPTGGTVYIPIPQGSGANFAGLFSVDVPKGIRKGQEFRVVVRQLTSIVVSERDSSDHESRARVLPTERFVYGSFQISIPVSTKSDMLVPEERLLSTMLWIQQGIPSTNRWYPVFLRYVEQIRGRVTGLGGDPSTIGPSPVGAIPFPITGKPGGGHHGSGKPGSGKPGSGKPGSGKPGQGHHGHDHDHAELTGKICGIVYDHFGDFEGFSLETEDGERHRFDSTEHEILRLVQRAWAQRILISVLREHERPKEPRSIVFLSAPPPFV